LGAIRYHGFRYNQSQIEDGCCLEWKETKVCFKHKR